MLRVEIEDDGGQPDASDAVCEARSAIIVMGAVSKLQQETMSKPHMSLVQRL